MYSLQPTVTCLENVCRKQKFVRVTTIRLATATLVAGTHSATTRQVKESALGQRK